MAWATWRERWQRVWTLDLRSLAVFRVALATLVLGDALARLCNLRAFHTDAGILPREALLQVDSAWRLDLLLLGGDPWFAALALLATIVAAVALAFGHRTRASTLVLFVLVGSLQNRNPLVLLGSDTLIACLLFWALFLPLGARWSVDAALSTRAPPEDPAHRSWASAGLLLQVLAAWFFGAAHDALALDYGPVAFVRALSGSLLPSLGDFACFAGVLAPLLALSPVATQALRTVALALLAVLQVALLLAAESAPLAGAGLAALPVLVGGGFWDWQARQRSTGRRIRIYYDRDCTYCAGACRLLEVFLVLPRAEIAPAQDNGRAERLLRANHSWVVIDDDDVAHTKWPALVALLRHSLPFRGLAGVFGWRPWERPGNALCDALARQRPRLARAIAWLAPEREPGFEVRPALQRVAAAALFAMLAWNLAALQLLPEGVAKVLQPPLRLLRIDQSWSLLTSVPSAAEGWVVLPGTLEDGREVDALRPGELLSWTLAPEPAGAYDDARWRAYGSRLGDARAAVLRPHFGRYLCRRWNDGTPAGQRLLKFTVTAVQEFADAPDESPRIERRVGWWHECERAAAS